MEVLKYFFYLIKKMSNYTYPKLIKVTAEYDNGDIKVLDGPVTHEWLIEMLDHINYAKKHGRTVYEYPWRWIKKN